MPLNKSIWVNKKVLITGHSGFKGVWLSLIMATLGAKVIGASLPPEEGDSLFVKCGLDEVINSNNYLDLREPNAINNLIIKEKPEVIFHLAAQAFVREGYRDPLKNWSTNIMGSVNLLEAVRKTQSVTTIVFITSDKCYQNNEWHWGYRETDQLGGYDPYSASKACSEILAASYRDSFFSDMGICIATARAGNVIGGGDYSPDRLISDIFRSIAARAPVVVRNINAIRPWQHVIDALGGYILLAEKLLLDKHEYARSFNFGPDSSDIRSVKDVLQCFKSEYEELKWEVQEKFVVHEAKNLLLDSSLAKNMLGWHPKLDFSHSIKKTIQWHKEIELMSDSALDITLKQINSYIKNDE